MLGADTPGVKGKMRSVRVTELKDRLPEFLRAVARGEPLAIVKGGRVVAHLEPAARDRRVVRAEAVGRFRAMRSAWEGARFGTREILGARHDGHRA
jgi:prevent-host-death family protein